MNSVAMVWIAHVHRGFKFVDFPDNHTAAMAREHLIRLELDGKKLKAEYATPSRDKINRSMSSKFE
jgi:RNA recognition motif-containing protein